MLVKKKWLLLILGAAIACALLAIVFSVTGIGDKSEKPGKTQKIEAITDGCNGFTKERFSLNAKAQGKLKYYSSDGDIVLVDGTGEVYLNKVGKATITIEAGETDEYAETKKEIVIKVCPRKLKPINMETENIDSATVKFKWNKVAFAEKYQLLRYSLYKDEYIPVKEFDASTTETELNREDGQYKVKALTDVHGTILESVSEEPVTVQSSMATAKAYDSLHVIGTLDSSKLDTVTTVAGSGNVSNAQSMCMAKDKYVVAFINNGNSAGLLKSYSRDGEALDAKSASGMYHANGCTYNPYTNRIYVCKTYAGHHSRALEAFDADTLEGTGTVGLSRAPSGIAYDDTNNRYYMSASWRLYVMDKDFNIVRTIKRKRYHRSQDMGAYNGVALSCIWDGGTNSYIDMYRAADGAYIGSYSVPLGEIEAVCVDDGHFVILMNRASDVIYRTKDKIVIE